MELGFESHLYNSPYYSTNSIYNSNRLYNSLVLSPYCWLL